MGGIPICQDGELLMRDSNQDMFIPTFGSRYMSEAIPKTKLPKKSMDPRSAYHLIHDELQTQGNPTLNMASFVTTIMDEECDRLISENLGVNYIDTKVYRANMEIHDRCVAILNDLCNAPDPEKAWGTDCAGSSEAVMLAILAHKRAWQEKRQAQGKPHDKPNIVMGNDVHLVWNKGANYFEIEQRLIPLHPDRFTISAEEVLKRVDENTICAVGVLGTSYTFQYDPIEEINNALVKLKHEKGLDVPLHVDGASGVFIAPFLNPELKWDFRLEQVKTIRFRPQVWSRLSRDRLGAVARCHRYSPKPHHRDQRFGLCRKVVQSQLLSRRCHDPGPVLQLHPARP
jgi:glutamate decarboxylase